MSPLPVRVTTRIITFLVGNPYKPSFPLLLGGGTTQLITFLAKFPSKVLERWFFPLAEVSFPENVVRILEVLSGTIRKWRGTTHTERGISLHRPILGKNTFWKNSCLNLTPPSDVPLPKMSFFGWNMYYNFSMVNFGLRLVPEPIQPRLANIYQIASPAILEWSEQIVSVHEWRFRVIFYYLKHIL